MTVIGKSILSGLVDEYKVISPVSPEGFDGDGYVLTVREDRTLNYLEHRNMISKEVIFTPRTSWLISPPRAGSAGWVCPS